VAVERGGATGADTREKQSLSLVSAPPICCCGSKSDSISDNILPLLSIRQVTWRIFPRADTYTNPPTGEGKNPV
jgi:hypothetical protein